MPSSPIDIGDECLWFRDPGLGPLYAILLRNLRNPDGSCICTQLEKDMNSAMELCGTGIAGLDFNEYSSDNIVYAIREAAQKTVVFLSDLV